MLLLAENFTLKVLTRLAHKVLGISKLMPVFEFLLRPRKKRQKESLWKVCRCALRMIDYFSVQRKAKRQSFADLNLTYGGVCKVNAQGDLSLRQWRQ